MSEITGCTFESRPTFFAWIESTGEYKVGIVMSSYGIIYAEYHTGLEFMLGIDSPITRLRYFGMLLTAVKDSTNV